MIIRDSIGGAGAGARQPRHRRRVGVARPTGGPGRARRVGPPAGSAGWLVAPRRTWLPPWAAAPRVGSAAPLPAAGHRAGVFRSVLAARPRHEQRPSVATAASSTAVAAPRPRRPTAGHDRLHPSSGRRGRSPMSFDCQPGPSCTESPSLCAQHAQPTPGAAARRAVDASSHKGTVHGHGEIGTRADSVAAAHHDRPQGCGRRLLEAACSRSIVLRRNARLHAAFFDCVRGVFLDATVCWIGSVLWASAARTPHKTSP